MSNGKVDSRLRKTLEAQFILQMTFWLTVTSYELIGNSIRESLETEKCEYFQNVGILPMERIVSYSHGNYHVTLGPLINDSPSPGRSEPRIFILLRI